MNLCKFSNWLVAAFILCAANTVSACTCAYMGQFQDYAESNPIVVRATILRMGNELPNNPQYFETMLIEVTDIYKGNFSSSYLTLQGDTGMSCLKYISSEEFDVGSEFLFSLSTNSNLQGLGGCGESYARIEDEIIRGTEFKDEEWSTYSVELSELVRSFSEK